MHIFVKFYQKYIPIKDKENLKNLVKKKHRHDALTPEIIKILNG